MNKPGMILILYKGEELPTAAAVAIAEVCKQYGIVDTVEDLTVVYKDAEGIAKMIAGMNITVNTRTTQQAEIEEAVKYIGKRFKRKLTEGLASGNLRGFAIALAVAGNDEEEVSHAIKVIATKNGKISKELQLNNNFNSEVVDIIRHVYEFESS